MNFLARFTCRVVRTLFLFVVFQLTSLSVTTTLGAFEWIPSDEEILKYRRSWNPLTNGPIFISGVDISPEGQYHAHPFLFGQFSEKEFGNQLTAKRRDAPSTLYALSPLVNFAYGWTDHIETELSLKALAFSQNGPEDKEATVIGPGDTSIFMKYRPIIQDPDTWRPSVTTFNQLVFPTERWLGTKKPAGGFAPLGRLPATRFGALTWTEGIEFRKNIRPFRFSAGVFYSYSFPGEDEETGAATYPGDLVNTRFVIEHILDDKRGFGYNLEFVGLHGLTFRADGKQVNAGESHGFNILGIEPAIQFKISETIVAAAGVLFTIAGQNSFDGIYPNFSIYFYGARAGKKPVMR